MPRGYSEGGEARECCTPLGPLHPPLAGLLRGRCGAATGSPQRRSHAGPHQPAPALSLHQAIAADPRNPLAKFERAAVLMAEDRWHDALAELRVLRVRRRRAAGRCTGKASAELGVPPAPAGGRLFLHRRGLDRRGWPLPLCGQHPVAPSFLGKAPPWLLGKRCRSRSSPLPRLPQRFAFCVVFLPTWSASSPPPGAGRGPPRGERAVPHGQDLQAARHAGRGHGLLRLGARPAAALGRHQPHQERRQGAGCTCPGPRRLPLPWAVPQAG